jgi:hypothetical protein
MKFSAAGKKKHGLCPNPPRGRRPLKLLYLGDALQGATLAGFGAAPHAFLPCGA